MGKKTGFLERKCFQPIPFCSCFLRRGERPLTSIFDEVTLDKIKVLEPNLIILRKFIR